ncbi:MAG: ECF transporter S component [Lachnospiraceae bacterium]|nr:ECF transporter S component [Lachnospiraceae bacterium]
MEKHLRAVFTRIIQILIVALLSFSIDYLIIILSHDDSIWLGESIEAVASIIFGPVVGFFGTLISCVTTDFLTYHSFEYSFVAIFEASSMALIGVIYRSLIKDEDEFGVREIVVFNFIQILVNTAVLYLSTPPAAVLFFGFIVEEWAREDFSEEMMALSNNTFSACISVALIGTVLLAMCTVMRKEIKEKGSISGAFKSIFKQNYINKEYRTRAMEYSIGFVFAVALTMVDGVVSGHVLGTDALAATSLMFPLVSLSAFISNIITSGCSNLCAISKGNGDHEKAKRLFTLGFFTTIFLGGHAVCTVLSYGRFLF